LGEGLRREVVVQVPKLGLASGQELEIGVLPGAGGLSEEELLVGVDPFSNSSVEARRNCALLPELAAWTGLCEAVGGVVASPLEMDPSVAGFDPTALAVLDSLILDALADSVSPGVALAVGRNGRLVRLRGYGALDWGTRPL